MDKDEKIRALATCANSHHIPEIGEGEVEYDFIQALLERDFRVILGWKARKDKR